MRRHLRLFLSQRRSIARRVTGVSMFTAEVLKDGLDFSRDIHLGHLRGFQDHFAPWAETQYTPESAIRV